MPNYRFTATGLSTSLTPEEEEIRREIRALKGLVLNRYVLYLAFFLFLSSSERVFFFSVRCDAYGRLSLT